MNELRWIKLVEFGEYQHSKGLQIVDVNSVEAMVEYFRSLRGKFMRKFIGLPIYIGHPDDPDYNEFRDKTVYGRIEDMKIENNALWILSRWTEMGKKIFNNKFLRYLSPRWMMKQISDKVFSPIRLISIGLTNHPNLRYDNTIEHAGELYEINNDNKMLEFVDSEEVKNDAVNDLDSNSENCVQDSKNLNNTRGISSTLHTSSLTEGIINSQLELTRGDKILKLVYEHMASSKDSYQTSWMVIKRQNPRLFK